MKRFRKVFKIFGLTIILEKNDRAKSILIPNELESQVRNLIHEFDFEQVKKALTGSRVPCDGLVPQALDEKLIRHLVTVDDIIGDSSHEK
ncbi:hypothetical protein EHQ53_14085 [Leptospira langatensis]|uniref:Uncharacterized protein n=1 Tax=Leptospira langatensis TaxID=2484983 RepID=A0ABY2M986_9LEPT|nr:hypothetical protein [Leptospira langatensis]TGL39647.1 hypothetical protein EHQ53_14085 [Leptospira langatensis]